MAVPGFLVCLLFSFLLPIQGSKCPTEEAPSKHIMCYYEGTIPLENVNLCNCTHLVFTNVANTDDFNLTFNEDLRLNEKVALEAKNLSLIVTVDLKSEQTTALLKSEENKIDLLNSISSFLRTSDFSGVELNFEFAVDDGSRKDNLVTFVKDLRSILDHHRVKRDGYSVVEDQLDDITTGRYTTEKYIQPKSASATTKKPKIKRKKNRISRDDKNVDFYDDDDSEVAAVEEYLEDEPLLKRSKRRKQRVDEEGEIKEVDEDGQNGEYLILLRLSITPEIVVKKYDLKALTKYVDYMTVPTHMITDESEKHVTFHPSRLMGLSDILNTDSILDLLTGLGAQKSQLIISIPANVLQYELKEATKNTARSPTVGDPQLISQAKMCTLLKSGDWTVERDEDLTAPYAFSKTTWLAFEDEISVNIKGKYIILRELAGGAVFPIDSDISSTACARKSGIIAGVLQNNFGGLARKPRQVVLESLQEQIHDTSFYSQEAGVHLSEYRIVRVVDHSGAVHVIRKNTKTEFECSRQGYFSHPLGCNKFYRCVKFNQYTDDFTVFEYDCPAGLAFDERWEVCVWPGSLPHGAPCTGSSEIAPVPRSHYECPTVEGYYADPENCRWFFACLDHARDGVTPLTAYEFRCPFGLVFDEGKLACDWPWLVGGCGARGVAGVVVTRTGGASSYLGTATGLGEGASYATVPDYIISGGRIANKAGGVILNQNIVGAVGGPAGIQVTPVVQTLQPPVLGLPAGRANVGAFLSATGSGYTGPNAPTSFLAEDGGSNHREEGLQTIQVNTPAPFLVEDGGSKHRENVLQTLQRNTPASFLVEDGGARHRSNVLQTVQRNPPANFLVEDGGARHRSNVLQTLQQNNPSSIIVEDGGSGHRSGFAQTVQVTTPASFLVEDGGSAHRANVYQTIQGSTPSSILVEDGGSNNGQNVVQTIHVSTPRPVIYEQQGLLAQQQIVSGQPLVYQQHLGIRGQAATLQLSTPSPIAYEGVNVVKQYAQAALVTPRPASYHRFDVSSGGLQQQKILQAQPVSLKPNFSQDILQIGTYGAKITPISNGGGYTYNKPSVAFELPSRSAYLTPVKETVVKYPQGTVYAQNNLDYKNIGNVVIQKPISQSIYTQQVVTPSPTVYAQKAVPVATLKPILYEQNYVTPKPVIYLQETVKEVQQTPQIELYNVTPRPVFKQRQPIVVQTYASPKPVVYKQDIIQTVVTPRPVIYQQPAVSLKPVFYQQQIVTPRPVIVKQQISTPRPVVYQQEVFTPRPIIYQQELSPVVTPTPAVYQQQYVTPTTDVHGQKNIFKQTLVTPKPVVYQQQFATPKPIVYQQQYVTPRPVVYEHKQEIYQQTLVTPKPVVYQQQVVTPKPVVYQEQVVTPRPVIYQQQDVTPKPVVYQQQVITPRPVIYQHQDVTPKPVVYQQQVVTPRPVIYQQQVVTPKPVVLQQEIVQQVATPKPVIYQQIQPIVSPKPVLYQQQIVTPKPVVYQQEYPAPVVYEQQENLETPKPVVYQQQVVTPKPVIYLQQQATPRPVIYTQKQKILQQTVLPPKPVLYQQQVKTIKPVFYQQQYVTPRPVVYTENQKIYQQILVTPKPAVVYQQQLVTPKPVIYQQEIVQPIVTPKPVVYQQQVVTPRPIVYQQQKAFTQAPIVYQQQQEVTPRPVVYNKEFLQPVVQQVTSRFTVTPKPVVYQPQITTSKPVEYQQQAIVTPKPVVYQQEIATPAVYRQEIIQPVITPRPVVRVYTRPPTTPKTVLYQQVFNIQTPQPVTIRKRPTVYQQEIVQPVVNYQQEVVTPQPVTYQTITSQKPIVYQEQQQPIVYQQDIVTPRPVIYKQKTVTPVLYQPQPVVYKQEIITPKPIVYQQEVVTPKPVVYQQEIVTPRPVIYSQRIPTVKKIQAVSYAKPAFYEQQTFITPKPVVYQEVSTPKTLVYQENYPIPQQQITVQQDILKVKPVINQEVSTPNTFLYQQRRKNIALIQTTSRPTFLQAVTSVTPTIAYRQETVEYKPIVVDQAPQIKIRGRIQTTPRTVYAESYERVSPGVAIQKEVYQPIDIVSTQSPLLIKSPKKAVYSAQEYLPPVTEGSLEVQKLGQFDVTTGQPLFTISETPKYGINTRIEIAPPPDEYALNIPSSTVVPATSTVYTIRPRTRVRTRPVTTTETSREYLPPIIDSGRRAKSRGKTTIVSIGQVDKAEVDDQNIDLVLDKYSGKFGELSDVDKDKFVTKVIQGNERGTIKVGKEPEVSTVGYEITSAKARARARVGSRKFSSTSTSTTEDYEEFGSSSTTPSGPEDIDNGDISLATLDLKNLKIKKNKKTVIVVSQVSDANPILIGKLAGQCSCQSNKVELRNKNRRPSGERDSDNNDNNGGSVDSNDDNHDNSPNSEDSDSGYPTQRGNASPRGRSKPRSRTNNRDNTGVNDEETTRAPARGRNGKSRGRRPNDEEDRSGGSIDNDGPQAETNDNSNGYENGQQDNGNNPNARNGRPNGANRNPENNDDGTDNANLYDEGQPDRSKNPDAGNGRRGGARSRRPNNDNNVSAQNGDSERNSGLPNGIFEDDGGDTPVLIGSYGRRRGGSRGGEPIYLDNIATEDGPGGLGQVNVEILNEDGSPTRLISTTTIIPEVSPSILLPLAPARRRPTTEKTVTLPEKPSGRRIPSRSRSRVPLIQETSPLFTPITADEIASTINYGSVQPSIDANKISSESSAESSKTRAGAAFDRYGPGGWRSADETLQGSVDCKRPGLFRHPKYCNKFYSCNYDPWKKRYTLSVFNCPVHLAYDSQIGACNWPSKGPACADDNLLV